MASSNTGPSWGKLNGAARQLVETQLLSAQERTHRSMSQLKHTLH